MSAGPAGGRPLTRAQLKRELKARRRALRRLLPELRRAARARVSRLPAVQKARARKRFRRALALAALALVALFARCECRPAPAEVAGAVAPEPEAREESRPPARKPGKPGPVDADGQRLSRARFATDLREAPPWMDEYRLQVAARSVRLAKCFEGEARPGALRWIASVDPKSGAVSDHVIEPAGPGNELKRDQRECLLAALSSPPYRLTAAGEQALPDRVGLVIEF